MIGLVIYFLAAFGLAYIVGHSVISQPVRTFIGGPVDKPRAYLGLFIALIECPACFGTWIGLVAGAIYPILFWSASWWVGAIVGACATAGVNFMLGTWTGLMPNDAEPDPIRAKLAALVEQQLNPNVGRMMTLEELQTATAGTMDMSQKFRANAAGELTPDEGLEQQFHDYYARNGLVVLDLEAVRAVLEPLRYFASGDAHHNEVVTDSLAALTAFDAKHPGVLVVDPDEDDDAIHDDAWVSTIQDYLSEWVSPTIRTLDILQAALGFKSAKEWNRADEKRVATIMQDLGWSRERGTEGWMWVRPDDELPRGINGRVVEEMISAADERARNAPEDTPENWAKYRDLQEAVDVLSAKNLAADSSEEDTRLMKSDSGAWFDERSKRRYALLDAKLAASTARPQDPMVAQSLNDAPMPEGMIIPEDIKPVAEVNSRDEEARRPLTIAEVEEEF